MNKEFLLRLTYSSFQEKNQDTLGLVSDGKFIPMNGDVAYSGYLVEEYTDGCGFVIEYLKDGKFYRNDGPCSIGYQRDFEEFEDFGVYKETESFFRSNLSRFMRNGVEYTIISKNSTNLSVGMLTKHERLKTALIISLEEAEEFTWVKAIRPIGKKIVPAHYVYSKKEIKQIKDPDEQEHMKMLGMAASVCKHMQES